MNTSPTRLKASFAAVKNYRDQFKTASAQLTISVGQAIHEGERLQSTVTLINQSFKSCKVMIDDSIQSYTLGISDPFSGKAVLLKQAIQAGDDYLEKHLPVFQSFTIPFEVIRWRDWLHTPEWLAAVEEMHRLYKDHVLFRAAIVENIAIYLDRYQQRQIHPHYDRDRAMELCRDYLLEECGVMKNLWPKLNCEFEVYPSGRNKAMEATYTLFIEPLYPHLLRSVSLRFHRRRIDRHLLSGVQHETDEMLT